MNSNLRDRVLALDSTIKRECYPDIKFACRQIDSYCLVHSFKPGEKQKLLTALRKFEQQISNNISERFFISDLIKNLEEKF